ncbi:hypothetical protein [Pseudomonas sp. Marseille-Q5115]|uniref:hypothetical protein n=1 Tax=Pseudomonas sp. Marseille-Q5115 TaxID=2866593 RepID=UPI001CE44119|nr:hypothetical protein [Pseudomonas sp. Marseille-Q5115]
MKAYFLGWTAQYERRFIAYLAISQPVEVLAPPRLAQRVQRKIQSLNKRLGGVRVSDGWLGRVVCRLRNAGPADLLVCNEGQVRRNVNPAIVRAFPGRKVLLVRDLVDAAFLSEVRPLFDAIYSFDQQQCEALGMRPLNQFFPLGFTETGRDVARSTVTGHVMKCFFLGRDKGRAAMLEALAQSLRASDCEPDFYIVRDETTNMVTPYHVADVMDYEQNLAHAQQADVLVEINQPGQAGVTLRTLEAAYFGKKLITNNGAVKSLPLYHPSNVYVLSDDGNADPQQLRAFLRAPLVALPDNVLYRYSPDFMLEQLLADARAAGSNPVAC